MACVLIPAAHLCSFFTDDADFDESFVLQKRLKSTRTPNTRANPSRAARKSAPDAGASSRSRNATLKRKSRKLKGPALGPDDEDIPDGNMKTVEISVWRRVRRENHYRFLEKTTDDPRFWTQTQRKLWDDFYDDTKMAPHAKPCTLNLDWHNLYLETDFSDVDEALKKMGLFDLVCLSEPDRKSVV